MVSQTSMNLALPSTALGPTLPEGRVTRAEIPLWKGIRGAESFGESHRSLQRNKSRRQRRGGA